MTKITSVTKALKKAERTLFLSGWDWVRSKALTEYAKYIENKARKEGKQFWIVSTGVYKVQKVVVDKWNERTPVGEIETLISGTFGNHIRFVYGDDCYYIQLDGNPFFHNGGFYSKIPVEEAKNNTNYYAEDFIWKNVVTYETDKWQQVFEGLKNYNYEQSKPYRKEQKPYWNIEESTIYIY